LRHRRTVRRGRRPRLGHVQCVPQSQAFPRLPRDARQDGRQHRRLHHLHSRPHSRRCHLDGDENGQALLHAKTADARRVRGALPDPLGQAHRCRHANGKPGARRRADPPRGRVGSRRDHRQRHRGAHLDQPPDLAAGHDRAPGQGRRAQGLGLGFVAWPGVAPTVRQRVRSVFVARLVGLWHRGAWRHGLPYHGHGVVEPRAGFADECAGTARRQHRRERPELGRDRLPIRLPWQPSAGEACLVRRQKERCAKRAVTRDHRRRQHGCQGPEGFRLRVDRRQGTDVFQSQRHGLEDHRARRGRGETD